MRSHGDILVIGAGLAGLAAAWTAVSCGQKVEVVAKGWGATHWHSGCVDVLGYYPPGSREPVSSPGRALRQLAQENQQHPYALVGPEVLDEVLQALKSLCARAGYPLQGSLDSNWLLPSAAGAYRPTCLAPEMMTAGDLSQDASMLLVGFRQFPDFFAGLAAENLRHQGISAAHLTLDLPELASRRVLTGVLLAGLFENPSFRAQVSQAIRPHIADMARIGFPAVLGMQQAMTVKRDLEARLERPVFEIPILPPSVPGMRLHAILLRAIEEMGGRVEAGIEARGASADQGRLVSVACQAAARVRDRRHQAYVLATGGILGGGIVTDFEGQAREAVFDLPVWAPPRLDWFRQNFLDPAGHPIYRAGLGVDGLLRPVGADDHPVYTNLFAAGTILAHCDVIGERSLEGVALATGFAAGRQAVEQARRTEAEPG